MDDRRPFTCDILKLDWAVEVERITSTVRDQVHRGLGKRGVVVALSGGIDSSLVGALCVRALGPDAVHGLMMPERESSPDTLPLAKLLVEYLGISCVQEDITPVLEAVGFYRRRNEAIRTVVPDYGDEYKCKIGLPSLLDGERLNIFSLLVESPEGIRTKFRLTSTAYLGIVAATNFKQRVRKMFEYYYADKFNYAVTGTPNRLEYDQGFFVKLGDGAADIKPIAHLYKTQVYQMARFLGLPAEICERPPTTDTYSLPQSQEEFYFALAYDKLDLCLFGKNHGYEPEEVAPVSGLTTEQVEWIYRDIDVKRRATRYLHSRPLLVEEIKGADKADH